VVSDSETKLRMEFYRDELPDGVEEALWQRGMVEDR
jgi:hypothetical protein